EAIALGQELKLMGKPTELLKRALAINPQHQKGIWLSGFAYYQAEAYPLAIQHWKNLQSLLPADSPDQQILNKYIEQASQRGGIKQTDSSQSAKINIKVNVKLDNSLQGKVSANDTVFIYANAAQGPRMPLAIVRKQVRDLPVTVTLNETMAMTPQMSLLNFPEIIINARISKSGQAVSQAGDLIGQTGKLKTNDTTMVNIEINQVKE
ncbi:MAG: c-type cytochrome biogenesis protein CcmI, partial [Gammaproteobacteria bacterium]|nr:c-type cytochrome biogenesis protein CcmI [Gammaproteobacteria bacterium]